MKLAPSFCTLALLTLGCTPAESQGRLTLEKKLPVTFAQLSNVVELRDGRIAFADTRAKHFLTADLQTGRVDTLGTRVDSLARNAPAEQYRFPGWVAHLRADTVALVDFSGLRTTLWNESGKALGVLPIVPVAGTAPVLVYDTVGHGYKVDYQSVIGGAEPGTPRPDSVAVLRIALATGKVDTVANLAAPEYGEATFGEQRQEAAKVFAPNDFFGVLPDGTAWLARGRDNRVDWRAPNGTWTRGTPHAYTKAPVTQTDRDRVLAQVREQGKQFGMPQDLAIRYPFADTKPPFDFALGRPNGEVWLQRPRMQEDAPLTYDVFDRKGSWQRAVKFPTGTSLAGFGPAGAVYGSIKEADGQRTVGRFALQ
ncbi:MAG: hypothetical protein M3Q93_02025 [Gemmatimonadota bacterium]|nr:hypothetical protein [Gemmatimonadales bacterium]MDQ3136345.1 hypothetical protein [Gemmatimonadota bacterium]